MIKISFKKARVLFKMNDCRPFSYKTGLIKADGTGVIQKRTIFGIVREERSQSNGTPSAYDPDPVFRECSAEEYMRREEYKIAASHAQYLLRQMERAVFHAEYTHLPVVMNLLERCVERIWKIQD